MSVKEHAVIYLSPSDDPEREWCEDDVWENSVRYNLGTDYDAAQSELAALREALEHIEKTCGQSRTVTRRLRWIAKRAELALAGRPYVASEHELPVSAEKEHFKLLRQNGSLKERLSAAEQRNAKLVELLRDASNYTRHHDYDWDLGFIQEVAALTKPTESGASDGPVTETEIGRLYP